ncbi:sterol desaturase family protein [Sphingorhabdus sp. EL138]|uniref:sterol desaturase family protein n=1 Tax=Sphingorhabdus sp. EL138 TaxID=2073156 RepID=UPI001C200CA9|nr:sterol desaturase family protein [Sphingorhabdus sp. EL138]
MTLETIINSNIAMIVIPLYFAAIFGESIANHFFHERGAGDWKDNGVSMGLGLVSAVTNGATAFISVGVLFWVQQFQFYAIPLSFVSLLICFILDDLRYYWHHRIAHRCRWVWAMHVVHHSSTQYNFSVALRQGWTKHFTGTMMFKVPLVLIGFDPVVVLFCGVINPTYQFFLHTELVNKMPRWFEFLFNTPSHHRVHHGRNPLYLDANYAGTLIIWDRMFGTFVPEDESERVDYGLVKNLETLNPFTIIFHEYWNIVKDVSQKGISVWQRLLYLLAPPGWCHDGSRLSSDQIKADYFRSMAGETEPDVSTVVQAPTSQKQFEKA